MAAADAKAALSGGAAKPASVPVQAIKKGLPAVVTEWAATLTPKNAPEQKHKGPLAWVREVEVPKLLAALAKEGYK